MFRACPFSQPGTGQCGSRSCAVEHCTEVYTLHLHIYISFTLLAAQVCVFFIIESILLIQLMSVLFEFCLFFFV